MAHECTIRVWPDASWQHTSEEPPLDKSDDFRVITVHDLMPDSELDVLAIMAANGAPDDAITDAVVWWMNT